VRRFAYSLALRLGYPNVDHMLRQMSSLQLQEWMVYNELDPIGEERKDQRAGAIVSAVYNVNRSKKRRASPFTIQECSPMFGDAVRTHGDGKKMPWQMMKQIAMALTASSRGK